MRRVTIILVIVFLLLVTVVTISCDSTQEPEPEAEAWAVIGADGGVVEVTDPESSICGTRIEIPPDALTEEITISINETTFDLYVSDKCELASVTPGILIEPDNILLSKNCTITLPYSDLDDDGFIDGTDFSERFLSVYFALSGSEEAYLANDYVIDTDANVIHISTDHFSKWKWWGQRWKPGVTVNYYIESVPHNGDDESLFHQEIADAFLMWQTALDDLFTFDRTENADEADIVFRKKNFCEWFDGLDCDAAGSTAPGYSITGEFTIYFNTHIDNLPRRWIANDYCNFDYSGPPFLRVAVHEIGHAIGLNDIRDTVNVGYEHTACNPTCDIDNRVIMRYDAGPLKPFICLSCLDISNVRSKYGLATQSCAADEVRFCDANFEAVIREVIGKPTGAIYASDLEELTFFGAPYGNIACLCGLEHCTDLTKLGLWSNQVSNIWSLANLTNLTSLAFGGNEISDISPLANLTDLTELGLWNNQVSNIWSLANLTNLTYLSLSGNQISDISTLSNLTDLTDLRLYNNQISDISPLVQNEGLGTGDEVYLQENPLSSDSINIYIPQLQARGVTVYY